MNVELRFSHMDDFEPEQVVQQVEPLRKLLEARAAAVRTCVNKMDGNDKLEELLQDVIDQHRRAEAAQRRDGPGPSPRAEEA